MIRKRAFLLLLFFFLGAGTLLSQELTPEAAKLYNNGNQEMKNGNFSGAVEQYDKALAVQKDYRIYYQKGVALMKDGKNEEAKSLFEEVTKLNPDFAGGYNALGGTLFMMRDFEGAAVNYEKVLVLSKDQRVQNAIKNNLSIAYTKVGNEAADKGSQQKAISYLEKATALNNYDVAYLSLAKIYSDNGDNDKAINAAENALKNKKDISKGGPYYYMGVAYKNKGDSQKAKDMFKQAQTDPTYKKLVEYELSLLSK